MTANITNISDTLVPKILPILIYPNVKLTRVCDDVVEFDENLQQLALNLFTTMKKADGIGLAAPQVGISLNFITIWIDDIAPLAMANPRIITQSQELFEFNEGCLSVPGYFLDTTRPANITVEYEDIVGTTQQLECNGLTAFVIQHEIDHLIGRLFIDELSPVKKIFVKKKIKKTITHRNKL